MLIALFLTCQYLCPLTQGFGITHLPKPLFSIFKILCYFCFFSISLLIVLLNNILKTLFLIPPTLNDISQFLTIYDHILLLYTLLHFFHFQPFKFYQVYLYFVLSWFIIFTFYSVINFLCFVYR